MHWAIAFCMLFMLLTIFLRTNWMNKNNVSDIMETFLKDKNSNLTKDELILMAKKIRKPMWEWHIYIGYVLVGLYSIRLILPFFGQMKFSNPFVKGLGLKIKFRFWTYIIFYICVGISLTTGLLIEFGSDEIHELMEEVHALSIYYLLAFIFIHFTGVLIAEFTNEKGLISKVISGNK
jgi:cytochrome b561